MALFTGIGDFFRGAFGESDEEKKRRKQREAQEAANRRKQAQPVRTQQTQQRPTQSSTLNEGLAPKPTQPKPQVTPLQQTQPPVAPAPRVQAPKPQPTPVVKQAVPQPDYKTLGAVKDIGDYYGSDLRLLEQEVAKGDKADQKRIEGLKQSLQNRKKELTEYQNSKPKMTNASLTGVPEDETKQFVAYTKQQRQKAAQLKQDQTKKLVLNAGNGNKARFTVAEYAKFFNDQPKEQQVQVLKGLTQQAEKDDNSKRMLEGLKRNGLLEGDLGDVYQGWIQKSGGGFTRAGQRLGQTGLEVLDKVLPGQDQAPIERWDKAADRLDENYRNTRGAYTKSGKGGESLGTATKAGIDIATLFGGGGAAQTGSVVEKGSIAARALSKLPGKAPQVVEKLIPEAAQSLVGTGIGAAQTRGKGDKQNLAKDATIALAADLALPGAGSLFGKIFRGGTEEVDDAARVLERELADNANLERNIADRTRNVEEATKDLPNTKSPREQELEQIIADDAQPAFTRQAAQEELDNIRLSDPNPAPLDRPAFQHQQDIQRTIDNEVQKLERMVNSNPDLTPQQLEQATEATKQNIIKLTDELKANRYGTEQVVTEQAAKTADDIAEQQAVNAAVKEAQTPTPGQVVEGEPAQATGEIAANDGTRQSTNDILYGDQPAFQERDGLKLRQKLSPDRVIRENVTRPVENLIDDAIAKMQISNSRLARGTARVAGGFSREAGVTPELMTARMQLRGGIEAGKLNNQTINELGDNLSKEQLEQIWSTIDTDFAARSGKVVDPATLSPEQQALRQKLVDIRDNTTVENMKRGLITKEQAANGDYINRDYSVLYDPDSEAGKFEQGFRQELLGQYKGRKVVSDEMVEAAIKDPAYLIGKKQAQSEAAWAMQDYGNFLSKNGNVSDVELPGFRQLPDTPLFGDARGKFVPKNLAEDFTGFQYDMAMVSAFNDMITAYDRWGLRQAKKQLLTVFNPAVRLGNQVTNRVIFSQLAGINPVEFNIAMQSAKNEIKAGGQLYREAVQQGLTGVDVTQADFFAKRIADSADGDKGVFKKALEWTQNSYSGADDQARIAAYMVKRQQGYPAEEAARQVQRSFQDYKSVGFFYDIAAKTPIIGNAFVRFAADSARIAKNAAVDHPLRAIGTVAAWSAFVNGMSVLSGESTAGEGNIAQKAFNLVTGSAKSEAQKEREGRLGAPKLPFTDISTAVQTPWGEINVARFMPWYSLNDIDGGNVVSKLLPFSQLPVEQGENGKFKLNPQAMNDPLFGQVVQLATDEDFRGKSISDPMNNEADKFRRDPLSKGDKWKNRFRFLFNNNAPVGREIDQTAAAYGAESDKRVARGEAPLPLGDKIMDVTGGTDMYGKKRGVIQSLFRDAGFKIEQQGDEQRKDRSAQNTYAEEQKQIQEELSNMSPDAQEAWKRLTGFDKMREQVPNEFKPGEMRNKKAEVYNFSEEKWRDFASHPELYKLMVDKKQREHARSIQEHAQDPTKPIKPVQPEFDPKLSESFRKQLIQNKMVAPGDDAELDQRMYSSPEWDYYNDLKDQYKKEAAKYYPKSDKENFDDETVKNDDGQFPSKPPLLKSYSAQYKLYTDGKRDKPEWNDALTAQKEAYNKETLRWTNDARKKRGLPALTWDVWNNPTFGFDETPSNGGGFGFGFGGGGSRTPSVNTITNLTNFSDSVKRFEPVEAEAMPNEVAIFQKLMAGRGGRAKPKLGASARGQ